MGLPNVSETQESVVSLSAGSGVLRESSGPGAPQSQPGGWRARLAALMERKGIRATLVTMMGYGGGQALRLVTNLVLARILLPDAFGLMAIVTTLRIGLEMLSDIGIGPSIIQNPRGSERGFLNTAWTIQVARGVLLWLIAIAIAWPAAAYFQKPDVALLFAVGSVTVAIQAFNSTAMFTLNRSLKMGRITVMNLTVQVVGALVMVAAAWVLMSRAEWQRYAVWSLVIGGIFQQVVLTVWSHRLDRSVRNWFGWEGVAARSIIRFGVWIFVSSILTYLTVQLDRLLLGRLLTTEAMGVYSIGHQLGTMMPQAVIALGGAVIFPLLADFNRAAPGEIRQKIERVRMKVLLPASVVSAVLAVLGHEIVRVLYKPVYHDGGWVLEIIAAGSFPMMVTMTYNHALLALGRSREMVQIQVMQILLIAGGTLGGYHLARQYGYDAKWGFVMGLAVVEWLMYPWVAFRAWRNGIYTPRADGLVFAVAVPAIVLAAFVARW